MKLEGESVTRHFPGFLRIYLGPHLLTHIRILRVPPLSLPGNEQIALQQSPLADLPHLRPPGVFIPLVVCLKVLAAGRRPAGLGLEDGLKKVSVSVESSLPLSPLPEPPPFLMHHQTQASLWLLANPVFTVFYSVASGQSWDTGGMEGRGPKKGAQPSAEPPRKPP